MKTSTRSFHPDDLSTFPGNPRQGDVESIAASLEKHGQYRTIVVNEGTMTGRAYEVLAGNHTLLAARKLGWDSIDATLVDVDDAMCKSIVAADNRLADKGGYDERALLELLEGLDGNLIGTGYVEEDLQDLRDLLDDGDMWERGGGKGDDGADHDDEDDAKFHPEIKLQVDNRLFDLWRSWLDRYEGKDDVAKLEAALADVLADQDVPTSGQAQ